MNVFNALRYRATCAILKDRRMTEAQRNVGAFFVLKYVNGKTGFAYPSQQKVAADYGCSKQTVKRTLARLCALGYLRSAWRGGRKTKTYLLRKPVSDGKWRPPKPGEDEEPSSPPTPPRPAPPGSNDAAAHGDDGEADKAKESVEDFARRYKVQLRRIEACPTERP